MESVHFVPDQCANFASHFSSIKIFQIDLFYFASHFIRVQIFQICFSLKSEKFLFPPPHYNFGIVHWCWSWGNGHFKSALVFSFSQRIFFWKIEGWPQISCDHSTTFLKRRLSFYPIPISDFSLLVGKSYFGQNIWKTSKSQVHKSNFGT